MGLATLVPRWGCHFVRVRTNLKFIQFNDKIILLIINTPAPGENMQNLSPIDKPWLPRTQRDFLTVQSKCSLNWIKFLINMSQIITIVRDIKTLYIPIELMKNFLICRVCSYGPAYLNVAHVQLHKYIFKNLQKCRTRN